MQNSVTLMVIAKVGVGYPAYNSLRIEICIRARTSHFPAHKQ